MLTGGKKPEQLSKREASKVIEHLRRLKKRETYVAEFSCIEKEGEGYAFMPVRVEEKRLKENYPDYISITRKSKENRMQKNERF